MLLLRLFLTSKQRAEVSKGFGTVGCCLTGEIGRSVIVVVFLGTLLKEVRDADTVCVIKSLESAPNLRTLPRGVRDSLKLRGWIDTHVVINVLSAPRGTADRDVVVAL